MSFAFDSRRSAVLARHGMVAASQPLAVMAGVRILIKGAMPQIPPWRSPRRSMSPSQPRPE